MVLTVSSGISGRARLSWLRAATASTPPTTIHSTVTISAAAHTGRATAIAATRNVVSVPNASTAATSTPAAQPGPHAGVLALLAHLGFGEHQLLPREHAIFI